MGEAAYDLGYSVERVHPFPTPTGGGGEPPREPPKKRRPRRPAPGTAVVSEDRAALAFAERHRNELLYCHDTGAWYEWKGAAWIRNATGLAFHYARLLARDMAAHESEKVQAVAGRAGFASGVERLAQRDPLFARRAEIWDADPWLLGTPGGTVDLRTGILRPANPAEHITRLTAATPAADADCPTWLHFLDDATRGDPAFIRFIQQWGGYCLTGDTREQALCFAFGKGGNGKGVFVRTLSGIMKDYALAAAMETFTASRHDRHSTEIASLRGARLVTASETQEGRSWNAQRIKELTGGDVMRARFMRQDEFEFMPVLKLLFTGNSKPGLSTVGDAEKRRFNLLPFEHKPSKPDQQLEQKLRSEWPGILRWLINGCLDWQQNGLLRPQSVQVATAEYFADQDVFAQWLEDKCDVEPENPDFFEPQAALFKSWSDYAAASGERAGDMPQMAEALQRNGIPRKRTKVARGFSGVRLKLAYPSGADDLR